MPVVVQCPNPKCRKYMLVEDHDRNKVVACLICKAAVKVTDSKLPPPKPS